MGKLDKVNQALEAIRESSRPQAPEPPDSGELQREVLSGISAAISALGEAVNSVTKEQLKKLDESTTAQVIEIQIGIRKLVEALKPQETKVEVTVPPLDVQPIADAVGALEPTVVVQDKPSTLPIQFDINRNSSGFMTSVVARPYEEKKSPTPEIQFD